MERYFIVSYICSLNGRTTTSRDGYTTPGQYVNWKDFEKHCLSRGKTSPVPYNIMELSKEDYDTFIKEKDENS